MESLNSYPDRLVGAKDTRALWGSVAASLAHGPGLRLG